MTKTVLVLRDVYFEDMGAFETPLKHAGYAIHYCEMGVDDLLSFGEPDLLAILGAQSEPMKKIYTPT
jgi:hypothetical protein